MMRTFFAFGGDEKIRKAAHQLSQERNIAITDSKHTSGAEQLLKEAAAKLFDLGWTAEKIVALLDEHAAPSTAQQRDELLEALKRIDVSLCNSSIPWKQIADIIGDIRTAIAKATPGSIRGKE